jgi:hypothetical protein
MGDREGEVMKVLSLNNETKKATVELFGRTRELDFVSDACWFCQHPGEPHPYGDTNRCKGCLPGQPDERVTIYGFAIRYSQGNKLWWASMVYWPARGTHSQFNTPMTHRTRWAHVNVVGFWADVPEQYKSKRR